MRKIILAALLSLQLLSAASLQEMSVSLVNVVLVALALALLVLFVMLLAKHKTVQALKNQIDEKDEKIQWLRKVFAQKESSLNKRVQELEKNITELNHTIDSLEQKLKEGTKNQVVTKLESLERKREELLHKLKDA